MGQSNCSYAWGSNGHELHNIRRSQPAIAMAHPRSASSLHTTQAYNNDALPVVAYFPPVPMAFANVPVHMLFRLCSLRTEYICRMVVVCELSAGFAFGRTRVFPRLKVPMKDF